MERDTRPENVGRDSERIDIACDEPCSVSREGNTECIETDHAILPKRVKRSRKSIRREDKVLAATHESTTINKGNTGTLQDRGTTNVAHALLEQIQDHGLCDKYEYLDHTADVQLHSWGDTLQESFENLALCMFNYMTPLKSMMETSLSASDKQNIKTRVFTMSGNDMESLVYHWLDELLFQFSTEFFVPLAIQITEFDLETWAIKAVAIGDVFDTKVHACGTEIKAITYSAMQIYNENDERKNPKGKTELYVIVDI